MKKEIKYYGLHACLLLFEKRREDIIRVYIHESLVKICKPLLKFCAEQKKAYHIISEEELTKVSESVHHEGICILARETLPLSEKEFMGLLKGPACLLYLDGVQNPHNVGSIVRSAAHFGVTYILGERGKLSSLSPAAFRIAKGGAEFVRLVILDKPLETLKKLKQKGFALFVTSSHGGSLLYDCNFPEKSIIAMGGETDGVSKQLFNLASGCIEIPGSGFVESLNVSVATSLCLSEYYRRHGA